jgi:hypothetical protein
MVIPGTVSLIEVILIFNSLIDLFLKGIRGTLET